MVRLSENVEIEEINPIKKTEQRVVAGFAGIGLVGYSAISHIIKEKSYELKAVIKSHLIPPMILLIDGKPSPSFTIYSDDAEDTLFVTSNVVVSPENMWIVGLKLVEWFRKLGVREFVTVESMLQVVPQGRRPVYGFVVPERDLSVYGVQTIKDGAVSGLNAIMLEEAIKGDTPFVNFLVPTSVTSALDLWGALSVVEVLNKMCNLYVDVSSLEANADMLNPRGQKGKETKDIFGFLRKR